ncbi:MAG: lipopolysaccharide exporter [Roseivirga sp.]|jgi:lipopolysaccharide exporter
MMKRLLSNQMLTNSTFSLLGQVSFLLSNFFLFIVLLQQFSQATFGVWGLYITLISIANSIRNGMIQNGLTRFLIRNPEKEKDLVASGLLFNYFIIAISSLFFFLAADFLAKSWDSVELASLFKQSWKSLLALGSLQIMYVLCFAKGKYKTYFIINLIYFITFVTGIFMFSRSNDIGFTDILNWQLVSIIPSLIYGFSQRILVIGKVRMNLIQGLANFGKFIAGTNLLSLLFSKADILMIAFFLDPLAVALFHFATKIIQYVELPLTALSQVIYPRLAASYHSNGVNDLKKEYGKAVVALLALIIPAVIVINIFNVNIINLLSPENYQDAAPLIAILSIGCLFKPWGRVFGLTLDAIGKPKINFLMLAFSLVVNLTMNFILIPKFGVAGAAIATTTSIILTVTIGQFNIQKHTEINPLREVWNNLKYRKSLILKY